MVLVVEFDYVGCKTFTRKSGNTGQEILVSSGSIYPAIVSAVDKEVFDFSVFKQNDHIECECDLVFTSIQCVSDAGKKYYKRIATLRILEASLKLK